MNKYFTQGLVAYVVSVVFVLLAQTVQASIDAANVKQCKQAYDKLYSKPVLNISAYVGYIENDNAVFDLLYVSNLIEKAQRPCTGNTDTFCGFVRDADDADVLYKNYTRPNGKKQKIRLLVRGSSVSDSHLENTTTNQKAQREKSKTTIDKFNKSLMTDDIVLYSGHARRGTGPGFEPMDSAKWVSAIVAEPMKDRMLQSLKKTKTKPKIIGMLVCEGEAHYGKVLNEASPSSALLLTRQSTFVGDTVYLVHATVDALIKEQCSDSFHNNLKANTTFFYASIFDRKKTYGDKLPKLYGFFEPISKEFQDSPSLIESYVEGKFEKSQPKQKNFKEQEPVKIPDPPSAR